MVRGVKKQEADSAQNHVVLFMAGKRIMILHMMLVATKLYLLRKIHQDRQVGKTGAA